MNLKKINNILNKDLQKSNKKVEYINTRDGEYWGVKRQNTKNNNFNMTSTIVP